MKIFMRIKSYFLIICLSFLFISCDKKQYRWEAGISAPIYYPIGDIRVSFDNAENGSTTNIDPGWGQTYRSVVGEKWKSAPKEVLIHYASAAENYTYEGKVMLPQKIIRDLFNEYNLDDEDNLGYLVVGMAPGGWIRLWLQALDEKTNKYVNIEVAKAKLKGSYDNTADERYKVKNFKNWGKYYTYWQHHGIPYEAWAENEKEYNLFFDFKKPNNREVAYSYISADGTLYQSFAEKSVQKLPVQIEQVAWSGKTGASYNCKVPLPKNFKKYINQKNLKEVRLILEIQKDDQHATIYLLENDKKNKIVSFKNKITTPKEHKDVDFAYATEIEYFIQ